MESYNHMGQENSSQRANFPPYLTSAMVTPDSHHHNHNHNHHMDMNMNMGPLIHLQPAANYFHSPPDEYHHNHSHNHQASASNSSVKSEGAGGPHKHAGSAAPGPLRFPNYPLMAQHERRNDDVLGNANTATNSNVINNGDGSSGELVMEAMKAKIIAHPQYSNLLQAYMDCQKVGAPPDVSARLSAMMQEYETRQRSSVAGRDASNDPELDQFMEAYCDMLGKYREEITRPVQEAMEFMQKIESQLNLLTNGRARIINSDERSEGIGSSEEDPENSAGETELPEIDPRAEDRELKNHLLKKYSGYLSSLKQELSKKKKKGKLPKEARQKLLGWWELHYKWPYPSESEKVALAETTGLDQKQINNWFINQRKRHWKPSEDMQFMVMDGLHPAHNAAAAALYMDGHYLPDAPYRFGT